MNQYLTRLRATTLDDLLLVDVLGLGRIGKAIAAFDALGTTQADLEQHIGHPVSEWTPDDLQALMGLYAQKNTPAVDTTTGEITEEQA